MEHFEDSTDFLKEIKRILSDDGVAVIAVPRETKATIKSRSLGHKQFFPDIETLSGLLHDNGFGVIDSRETKRSLIIKVKKI